MGKVISFNKLDEIVKANSAYDNFIKMFPLFRDPDKFWGQRTVKHRVKNTKYQGNYSINWGKFKLMKRVRR